jgi:3D (Asp-Asp-Asp) domain-containing protein
MMTLALAGWFSITGYAVGCDVHAGDRTKTGVMPVVGWTIAADPRVLPMGSIVHIEGMGERMVQDIGGKVKGFTLDVYLGSCREARLWGRRHRRVTVLHVPEGGTR